LPSCDVLGYGTDVEIAPALSRDGGIHHLDIVLSLLFFSFFLYVLQIEFGARCPNHRYGFTLEG
jgi:hypothetical protein